MLPGSTVMPACRSIVLRPGRLALVAVGVCLISGIVPGRLAAQPSAFTATLSPADDTVFASETDSNSPAVWDVVDGRRTLFVLNSFGGHPELSAGRHLGRLTSVGDITWNGVAPEGGAWMEAVLSDEVNTWYGYYHNEVAGTVCPGSPKVVPRIGAARSTDRGRSWVDLGPILETSAGGVRCSTRNHYFLGGVGDFSVVPDRDRRYVYILYTQYLEPNGVGVAVARMPWASRDQPRGSLDVWDGGAWLPPVRFSVTEGEDAWLYPGAGAVHAAPNSWDDAARGVDVFWGPSVHWNTFLQAWVMLLNRAESDEWAQDGIHVSFNPSIDDPRGWSAPERLLEGGTWYPQVMGLDYGRGTDKEAGEVARFFIGGRSSYLIRFGRR